MEKSINNLKILHHITDATEPKKLNIPVILVISIKLGCLNHAILTSKAIMNDNVTAIGWIANRISKDEFEINENINTLKSKLKFKLLDII